MMALLWKFYQSSNVISTSLYVGINKGILILNVDVNWERCKEMRMKRECFELRGEISVQQTILIADRPAL